MSDVQKIIEQRIDRAYTAGKTANKHLIQFGVFCRNTTLIIFGLFVAIVCFAVGALSFTQKKHSSIQIDS